MFDAHIANYNARRALVRPDVMASDTYAVLGIDAGVWRNHGEALPLDSAAISAETRILKTINEMLHIVGSRQQLG